MCARSRGFTLVEVVVVVAIVSAALVGVLYVFQNTVRASADPQVRKQALAAAEALLERILLESFDDVDTYHGHSTAGGLRDLEGQAIPGLEAYDVAGVTVTPVSLNDAGATLTPVVEAKRITVTVTGPAGAAISLDGYRVGYAP